MDKVVVSHDGTVGLDSTEKAHHWFFEFFSKARDGARGMDFGKGHAEFVGEAPEAGEEDAAG